MSLLIGFGLVASLGIGHHFALLALQGLVADARQRPNRSIVTAFVGLLSIHLVEILFFALSYRILLNWDWIGHLSGSAMTWSDLIYFSGINFTTLGYTGIDATGPIRLIIMMQSLGGFMILTWSATFIYSVWTKAYEGL